MEICLKETNLMSWKRYNDVNVPCSWYFYVLNFFFWGGFDLLEEDDDDELLLVGLRFTFFFGDLEELCERPISSLSAEG